MPIIHVLLACVVGAPAVPPELMDVLHQWRKSADVLAGRNYRTVFRSRIVMRRPVDAIPLDARTLDEWDREDTIVRVVGPAGMYLRSEIRLSESGVVGAPNTLHELWDGSMSVQWHEPTGSITISDSPVVADLLGREWQFTPHDGAVSTRISLLQMLERAVISDVEQKDGRCSFRVVPPGDAEGRTQLFIELDREPQWRLRSLQSSVHEPVENDSRTRLLARDEFTITEWITVDGVQAPSKADFVGYWNLNDDPADLVMTTKGEYERDSLEFYDASEDMGLDIPRPQLRPGASILDSRYAASYRIGSVDLMMDGALYRLPEPAAGILDEEAFRSATRQDQEVVAPEIPASTVPLAASVSSRASSRRVALFSLLAGGGALFIANGVLLLIRARQGTPRVDS